MFLLTLKDHLIILKDWQVLPNYNRISNLEKVTFPIFWASIIFLTMKYSLWTEFVIYQISALLINPLVRVRAMSEHLHAHAQGQGKMHKLHETPTINANYLERFFFAPFNTNRHLEHHLYPTIPYFNLEKAHRIIKESELYKKHCQLELDGYLIGKRTSLNEIMSLSEELTIYANSAA